MEIRPQRGFQENFLSTSADIAIGGGSAGCGKSFALLMEGLRHSNNPKFRSVFFRRTTPEITNAGGLWDEAFSLYSLVGAKPIRSPQMKFNFPSGASASLAHLQYEQTIYNYQGSQIGFIGFDEVTHFSSKQFFYMLSRNRSVSGVKPYVRATCNPDPDSFVRELIDWYIGPEGYAIPERSGKIRYFIRLNDEIHWGNTREEIALRHGDEAAIHAKSFTFIAGLLNENKILLDKDPSYVGNLRALSRVDRERLENGNWNIRPIKNKVAHSFDEYLHVKEFNRQGFPVWCGQDFNVNPMTSVLAEVVNDTLFIFDELVMGSATERANTYQLSNELFNKFGRCQVTPDSTGRAYKTSATETDHLILAKKHDVKATMNPYRGDRFNCMNGLFEQGRIVIHPRCKNLIASLNNFEDNKKTEQYGHIIDSLGYLLWYLWPLKPKLEKAFQWRR